MPVQQISAMASKYINAKLVAEFGDGVVCGIQGGGDNYPGCRLDPCQAFKQSLQQRLAAHIP